MKELLVIGEHAFDVTGLIQNVQALNEDGSLAFQGNGIVIYRSQHIHGNAPIFLKHIGLKRIFGHETTVYSVGDNWKRSDYEQYTMTAPNMNLLEISYAHTLLAKLGIL